MTRRESQNLMIAKHLKKYKSITWMVAYQQYGVVRLSARCFDLKKKGIPIKSELITHGEVKYARYTLISSK